MVYNFRLVSDEVNNFRREIKIDASDTFLDLKNAICDSVGYDKNEMCSFFICDQNWEKEKEITFEDMGADADQDVWLMDETVLSDFIEDVGQRMMFVFDYNYERAFFIELKEAQTGQNLHDPIVTLSLGKAPIQIREFDPSDLEIKADPKASQAAMEDYAEEFYGSDDYSDDEFDPNSYIEDQLP